MELTQSLQDILLKNYKIETATFILLVYDEQCTLAKTLAEGYKKVITSYSHKAISFDQIKEEEILKEFSLLPKRSLVILVQSGSFRMTKHRLRADLFREGHQVIEHTRLSFNKEEEIPTYLNSLHYDTPYYLKMGRKIEKLLEKETRITYESGNGLTLTIDSSYEKPIKNTGDFTHQTTGSSGFPIGEIFTEAKDLSKINGSVVVFAFPSKDHKVSWCEPFTVTIQNGCLISHTGPSEFEEILTFIKEEEMNKVQIREIGFGLNRALGFDKRISEPTCFERFAGAHFSLGLKHAMYRKKIDKKIYQKYHVDIFCKVDKIFIGKEKIFENGSFKEDPSP